MLKIDVPKKLPKDFEIWVLRAMKYQGHEFWSRPIGPKKKTHIKGRRYDEFIDLYTAKVAAVELLYDHHEKTQQLLGYGLLEIEDVEAGKDETP